MYSLHLKCMREDMDLLSYELWEAGTEGIRETELDQGWVEVIAGFGKNDRRQGLLEKFARFRPDWRAEPETDWEEESRRSWPAREVGERLFLAPPWESRLTPKGRQRIIHNPGLACGTGEHPCTQLALLAVERSATPGSLLVDVGTGSGVLAIAALKLGVRLAVGLDVDIAALSAARENFALNKLPAQLAAGSTDCLSSESADLIVANINASVLLALADDFLRLLKPNGRLILTGFSESELPTIKDIFGEDEVLELDGWWCVISTPFSAASL